MGLIYKNSTLTIVAASAEKVTDGFLGNGELEQVTQLPLYVDKVSMGTVYARFMDLNETYSSEEPIFQRGWTFQELSLSPRAVVFDSSQITLKCLTDYYRPVFPTYIEMMVDAPSLPVEIFGMVNKRLAGRRTQESRDYYIGLEQDRIWEGIVAELARAWNDTYIAGFWGRTILKHLAWHRTKRKPDSRGFPRERGPFEGVVDCTRHLEARPGPGSPPRIPLRSTRCAT